MRILAWILATAAAVVETLILFLLMAFLAAGMALAALARDPD